VQTRDHPPLDANFFQRVAKHRANRYRDDRGRSLYARLENIASSLGAPALAGTNPAVSLEEFLGRLYFGMQHDPLRSGVRDYFTLVDLYAREVVTTTEWMIRARPARREDELMRRMLQCELANDQTVSIVTFNIDALIENTLEILSRSRPGAPWSLRSAYGFSKPFEPINGARPGFQYDGPTAEIPVYKMHGSVNWLFQTHGYYPPADQGTKKSTIWQLTDREVGYRRSYYRPSKGRRWIVFPLIVPPVYEKHALIRTHLHEVWSNAEEALASAERVVFWGYSFPTTDVHARHFFQSMSERNPALKRPVLINPDPSSAAALWSVLRPQSVAHYRDAQAYLAAVRRAGD
jgi:hypothetical protein